MQNDILCAADAGPYNKQKTRHGAVRRCCKLAILHTDSPFIHALGRQHLWHLGTEIPGRIGAPCENVAILKQMQAGRPALIQKDGGEMLVAIALVRPLADAEALVDDPAAFTQEMTRILLEKQSHPLIAQIIKPTESSFFPFQHLHGYRQVVTHQSQQKDEL